MPISSLSGFDIAAGIASIVGAGASLLAWHQAASASRAAREAKQAVLQRNLSDELETSCKKLEEIVDYLRNDRYPEATLMAGELTGILSELPGRRENLLSPEARDKFHNAREQLKDLAQCGRDAPIGPKQKQRMIEAAHSTSMSLRVELGKIKRKLD
jgi:hypothetical protein